MKRNLIIGAIVLVALILAWYFFMRKPVAATATGPTEARIMHHMTWLRKDPKSVTMLNEKAEKEGRSFEEQLRLDAIWYAERELKTAV